MGLTCWFSVHREEACASKPSRIVARAQPFKIGNNLAEIPMSSLTRRVPSIAILLLLALAGALTAGVFALTLGSAVQAAPIVRSVHKGPPPSAYHNKWLSHPNPPLPTSGPPGICGPWSAGNSAQV